MILYNYLITASSEGQVYGISRIYVVFIILIALYTDSDTECDRHLVADLYSLDLIEHLELVLLHAVKVLVLEHHEVFVVFYLSDKSVILGKILVYTPVDKCNEQRPLYVLYAVERLIIVVNIYKR